MALKNLLNNQGWDSSDFDYSPAALETTLRSEVQSLWRQLWGQYRRSVLLNGTLFLLTIGLYFLKPEPIIWLPIILIGGCFLFLLGNVLWQLRSRQQPDPSMGMKTFLQETLAFDQSVFRVQCRFTSLIIATSTGGGFLLGLIFRGWDADKMLDTPLALLIGLAFSVGMYFVARTKAFQGINRLLNPAYPRIKKALEERLRALEQNDISL